MTVRVYGLVDPFNGSLRYIGASGRRLTVRLREHIHQRCNQEKTEWIKSIVDRGGVPAIVTLFETVDPDVASAAEAEWIDWAIEHGKALLNREAPPARRYDEPDSMRPLYARPEMLDEHLRPILDGWPFCDWGGE